jgi:aminopeptidase N
MYYKGGNLLHTIRQIVDDDALWKEILRGLNRDFRHQVVTSAQVEAYVAEKSGKELARVFDQYLRHAGIPTFQYSRDGLDGEGVRYRWVADVEGFDMPIRVWMGDTAVWLEPSTEWRETPVTGLSEGGGEAAFEVDPNFYVEVQRVDSR